MRDGYKISERAGWFKKIVRPHGGDHRQEQLQYTGVAFLSPDDAAKRVGLSNRSTAYEAVTVVEKGIPEIIELMDRKEFAIGSIVFIARDLPIPEQHRFIGMTKTQQTAKIKELRQNRPQRSTTPPLTRQTPVRQAPVRRTPIVIPPMTLTPWTQPGEVERPPIDAPIQDHLAFTQQYGRVHLHPTRITNLLRDKVLIDDRLLSISNFMNSRHYSPGKLVTAIQEALLHNIRREADNGEQIDFGRSATELVNRLKLMIPYLESYITALREAGLIEEE